MPLERLRFGDFDGDGRTDAFKANGSTWTYSSGASSRWAEPPLAYSGYTVDELRFGNFDDDARTDVFGIQGEQWSWSEDGRSRWQRLNDLLEDDLDSLVFADFDGNGRTDIAQSREVDGTIEWRVSRDGTGGWTPLRTSSENWPRHLYEHWIGNFDSSPGADALRYEPRDSLEPFSESPYLVRFSWGNDDYVRHSWNGMR